MSLLSVHQYYFSPLQLAVLGGWGPHSHHVSIFPLILYVVPLSFGVQKLPNKPPIIIHDEFLYL